MLSEARDQSNALCEALASDNPMLAISVGQYKGSLSEAGSIYL
jgi:hypothetical protein